jgi:hypothetical protein
MHTSQPATTTVETQGTLPPRLARLAPGLACALLLVALVTGCRDATSAAGGASSPQGKVEGVVVANPTSDRPFFHDFGDVPYGARPRHVYMLENREGRAVRVQDIQTVCWCTQPSAVVVSPDGARGAPSADGKDLVIPAGGRLELAIDVDTKLVEKMNIDKLAVVRLRCDSSATPYLSFELHLVVKRAFRSVPAELDLGRVGHLSGKAGRVDCTVEIKGDPARIVAIERVEGPFEATLQETELAGETLWIVGASAPAGLPKGPISGRVVLRTAAPQGVGQPPPFEVPVRGVVVDDVVSLPANLAFGPSPAGAEATMGFDLVASMPGDRFRVLDARFEGYAEDAIRLEWTPTDADSEGRAARWRGVATLAAASAPARQGSLVLALDHPLQHELRIGVSSAAR